MAISVILPAALRGFAGGQSEIIVSGETAGEALAELTALHAELKKHLFDDAGKLRSFVNVYVNDEDVRYQSGLDTPVASGQSVMIVPSIAGGAPEGHPPAGHLELAFGWSNAALVVGWALDADTPTDPVAVHLYVNGVLATGVNADRPRWDLAVAMPWFGANHGFAAFVMAPGASVVCAYAINAGPIDTNPLLGCARVLRPPPPKVVKGRRGRSSKSRRAHRTRARR